MLEGGVLKSSWAYLFFNFVRGDVIMHRRTILKLLFDVYFFFFFASSFELSKMYLVNVGNAKIKNIPSLCCRI